MKIKNSLSILAGVFASMILIFVGEGISFKLNPLPATVDPRNILSVKEYVSNADIVLHFTILLIYAVGCFAGGMTAALIASEKKMTKAMSVGGILLGFGFYSLINIGHPSWVAIAAIFIFLINAYFGGLLGIKLTAKEKK
jgi:hypothetical protein